MRNFGKPLVTTVDMVTLGEMHIFYDVTWKFKVATTRPRKTKLKTKYRQLPKQP